MLLLLNYFKIQSNIIACVVAILLVFLALNNFKQVNYLLEIYVHTIQLLINLYLK